MLRHVFFLKKCILSGKNMKDSSRLYQIATYLNTVLLVACFGYLILQSDGDGSQGSTDISISSKMTTEPKRNTANKEGSSRGAVGFEELLLDIIEPVRKAAQDHNVDATQFIPTDEELALAVASNRLDSKESEIVLKRLERGYQKYNMPFPSLDRPSSPDSNPPPESGKKRGKDPKMVAAWLKPTIARLEDEASAKNISLEGLVPTKEKQDAAIASGSFDSAEFVEIQQLLQQGYKQLQIDLPDPQNPQLTGEEPVQPPSPSQPSSSENSAERQIINAYFQGQLQRIKLEAKKQEKDISDCSPPSADIQKAADSGSISSEASMAMINAIEGCYKRLDIPFHPPVQR